MQQKVTQPNISKKPTTFKLATPLGSWETDMDKRQKPLQANAPKIQNNTKHDCHALAGRVEANNASSTAA